MMSVADARAAADAGADAIGMILHANAKRLIDLELAKQIISALPPYVTAVGVFVDATPSKVLEVARQIGLTTVQFHGSETLHDINAVAPLRVIKAIRTDPTTIRPVLDELRDARAENLVGVLLETPVKGAAGGTGVVNDFDFIASLNREGAFSGLPPIILSGGLTPENVRQASLLVKPYAVDVSSGIEAEFGRKSAQKMLDFVKQTQSLL
jgi:phosphoribosylanthranilate isomerase